MPIFEADEDLDNAEFLRQQKQLSKKVNRLAAKALIEWLNSSEDVHENGDCWKEEPSDDMQSE